MSNTFSTVQEFALGTGGRLFVAPTATRDLVIIQGSVFGGPSMLPSEQDVLPALVAGLLDAGTAKKSKQVIRDALAAKGIMLSFGTAGDRTTFVGQCFPEDLGALLNTIVDCLTQANFPEVEVKNAKVLALGSLAEERTHTRSQAERALAALLYEPTHVNYVRSVTDEEKSVQQIRRADLKKFHPMLGMGGFVLAIAGDVTPARAHALVQKAFIKLGKGTAAPSPKHFNTKVASAREKLVAIADKANVDTLLGVSIPITLENSLYHPLRILTEMLGGGAFAAHLMRTIRDRDGLTYGIYAGLSGFAPDTDGYFKIWASFTPPRFDESVERTLKETEIFFLEGVTDAVLAETQARTIGSYAVSLATAENLARALHTLGVQNRPLSYLSDYPDIIRKITIAQVREAATLIPVDKLSLAAAGTFIKK